jgi:Dipeptidyl aminopeptidases/acylaminoacyl-peptidases
MIAELPSVAEKIPSVPKVEFLRVGPRQFDAAIVRPVNFDPGKKYPVILSVYAGPTSKMVSKLQPSYLHEQWMADQGFIVAMLDGRGTPGHGSEWLRAVKDDLIDIALEDQVTGLKALGEKYREMDLSRVGVSGWSFGGYFSAMATIRRPDVFQCGVAGAPVVDWEDYDTHYTERYLDLPSANPDGYKKSNVLTYVSQLKRPLLIIHGLNDDNVYFEHSLKLMDALFKAQKPYEFLPLLSTHMVPDPAMQLSRESRIMDFLQQNLGSPK